MDIKKLSYFRLVLFYQLWLHFWHSYLV